MPAQLPLYYPGDVRNAFVKDEGIRRIARVAGWKEGARILHLGCGVGWPSLYLAEQLGCRVTAADEDEVSLDALRGLVKARSLTDLIELKKLEPGALPFSDGEFEGILVEHRLALRLDEALKTYRKLLAQKGRLALLYPVKVGRFPAAPVVSFWETKLGEPLRSPRQVLEALETSGFEPQSVESLADPDLDDFYRAVEPTLSRLTDTTQAQALREELALHRSQAGKAGVTFAVAIGRRKEPGEKPPPSRSEG